MRVKVLYSSIRLVRGLLAVALLASVAGATLGFWTVTSIRVGVPSDAPLSTYKGVCVSQPIASYWLIALTPATETIFDIFVCITVTYKIQQY